MISKDECYTTLFIGNPGVGKSTLLNSLFGMVSFQSGVSLGQGLTKICQTEIDCFGNKYIDTPGLSDIKLRKQAAQEIKNAFTEGGFFKVFFVITLEEGRIRPDDKTTMKLVLDAAPIGASYSIIINKLYPSVLELFNDIEQKEDFFSLINEDMPGTSSFYLYPFDENLQEAQNAVAIPSFQFLDFVSKAPILLINGAEVKDIKDDDYGLLTNELEKVKQENQELQNKVDEKQQEVQKARSQSPRRPTINIFGHKIRLF